MSKLTLAKANQMINTALERAAEAGMQPLSVVVLDAGGYVKASQRQDNTSNLRFAIASGKAYGALAIGKGSRWLSDQAKDRPHFLEGISNVSGGKIIAAPGGVLIKNADNEILGAVGITGDTSENDELAAIAGIEAAGFTAVAD